MDAVRFGLSVRALRRRHGWTQAELGSRAGVSNAAVSRIERGGAGGCSVQALERLVAPLGARMIVRLLWQGEELDRLLDRDHAVMVEAMVRLLASHGWQAHPEVTFHIGSERGSIDVLASHPARGVLLVVEVKSVVPDMQAMLAAFDRKVRLAPAIAEERGLRGTTVARLLVLRITERRGGVRLSSRPRSGVSFLPGPPSHGGGFAMHATRGRLEVSCFCQFLITREHGTAFERRDRGSRTIPRTKTDTSPSRVDVPEIRCIAPV